MAERIVHIDWDGPFSIDELGSLMDNEVDYGIYQVYGTHHIYGSDVLLYIGKADKQTFGVRLKQEAWRNNCDSNKVSIYIGRLAGESTPNSNQWSKEIELAEKLLIYSHSPAFNSQSLNYIPDKDLYGFHVLNWGNFRSLLPEVSGFRWTNKFDIMPNYNLYGQHKGLKKTYK